MEREADVLPTPDGILILFLFLLDFCGFTSLGYNDDNSIASPHMAASDPFSKNISSMSLTG